MVDILIFILVLSILVLVHEFGHYIVAKKSGILVEEFGFGIPPRVWGKKFGETLYSINALPFGGFVKLHGEDSESGVYDKKRAFFNKPKHIRIAVILAGVIMNFILAVVFFAISYSFTGVPRETGLVKVSNVTENSPAATANLVEGDIVQSVNGQSVQTTDQFLVLVNENRGQEVALEILKTNGEEVNVNITPRENPPAGEGPIGVSIGSRETYFPPVWQRPFYGVYYGFQEAIFWGGIVLGGLGMMISKLFTGSVPTDVAGPVGIYALTSQAANYGILALINFTAILSVNLAIVNVLPFPALDGGRLLFIIIESIFGKRVVPRIEAAVHAIGMAILLLLLFAITAFDIQRLISAGGVQQFLENMARQQ
jgi:regulator of sigma E protease